MQKFLLHQPLPKKDVSWKAYTKVWPSVVLVPCYGLMNDLRNPGMGSTLNKRSLLTSSRFLHSARGPDRSP